MDMTNLKSALVSVGIAIVLAVAGYVIVLGDVFKIEWHTLVNVGVLAGLVAVVSLIKSSGTNEATGKFLNIIQVKKPEDPVLKG